MSHTSQSEVIVGIPMPSTLQSANFPYPSNHEVSRESILNTIKNMFTDSMRPDGVYAVAVEGPEGIGKSTLLSQFARRNSFSTISLFVSGANRLSTDFDLMRLDVCSQVLWIVKQELLNRETFDTSQLKTLYWDLQRIAKRNKEPIYFVIDGLEELDSCEQQKLLQQLPEILPIGIPQFRFLFSGDESLYHSILRAPLSIKSYPLTQFGIEETRMLLAPHPLSDEQLISTNRICRGIPGRIMGVLRALSRGLSIESFIQNPPSEMFEFDWKQVNDGDESLNNILALLAHDLKPHTVLDIAEILSLTTEEVQRAISSVDFIMVDNSSQLVTFVSTGLLKYAAARLRNLKSTIQKLIIKRLMSKPESTEAMLELPERLESVSQFDDLLTLLTPEHILQILERTETLSHLDSSILRGFRGARKLGRDADLLRFCLQHSVVSELVGVNIWESEVAALTALDREAEALTLVNDSILREDRLQLSSTLAYGMWLKGIPVYPELLDQIRLLIGSTDFVTLGKNALEIASKLICIDSELGSAVLQKAKLEYDTTKLDGLFANAAVSALSGPLGGRQLIDVIETAAQVRKDSKVLSIIENLRLILDDVAPDEVCRRAEEIAQTEVKLSVLRSWCAINGAVKDSDKVALLALDNALGTTSFQIDASFLADLAQALQGTSDVSRRRQLIDTLDGLRPTGERLGPSVDLVRMQLEIAKAESAADNSRLSSRLIEILDYIERIEDLAARGEAVALYFVTVRSLERRDSFEKLTKKAASTLEEIVLMLEESTAEHHKSLSRIICALSSGDIERAIDYTKIANTEDRRDAILVDVAKSLMRVRNAAMNIQRVLLVLQSVRSTKGQNDAKELIVSRFAEDKTLSEEEFRSLLPIIATLAQIEDSVQACRSLVAAMKIVKRRGSEHRGLYGHLLNQLLERWNGIDRGWVKLDAGFGIARDLAATDAETANSILTKTEAQKGECNIVALKSASAYLRCVELAIRAFAGLLPRHIEKESDIGTLAALIDVIPSYGERARLWSDVCTRACIAQRSELAEQLAQAYLQQVFSHLDKSDLAYWKGVLLHIAPGLYRTQPTACLALLDELDDNNKDMALWHICTSLIWGRVPFDTFRTGRDCAPRITKETVLTIEHLTSLMRTDWMIYLVTRDLTDALQSKINHDAFNIAQLEDFSRRFSVLAAEKLPTPRLIAHKGYLVITKAQAFRMRKPKPGEWQELINVVDSIDNVSDRAFVLQTIALCLPANMHAKRDELLRTAEELIEAIPWDIDRIDRYIGLAEDVQTLDKSLCRSILSRAAEGLKSKSRYTENLRHKLVDQAFHFDPELAKQLILLFDGDEVRREAQKQMRVLELQKSITGNPAECDTAPLMGEVSGSTISQIGWAMTRSLSGKRVQSYQPREIRNYLDLIAERPIADAYPLFVWYIDNLVIRFAKTEQADSALIKAFASCVMSAQLTGKIAGISLVRVEAAKNRSRELSASKSILARPGTLDEAMEIVSRWCEKNLGEEVVIHDYFFEPSDLPWLQLIRAAKPNCRICVMTSRKHQPEPAAGEQLEDIYSSAWASMYDQIPPKAEIAVIGGEKNGLSPIHDRWLISDKAGLRFGTSFNSLGLSRESDISELPLADIEERRLSIEKYLNRELREHKGEKLKLMRFWLT